MERRRLGIIWTKKTIRDLLRKLIQKAVCKTLKMIFFFKQDPSILWDAWGKTMFYFRRENMNFSVNLNAVKDIYHNWSQTTIAWIRNF